MECERCRGRVVEERTLDGWDEVCLACGGRVVQVRRGYVDEEVRRVMELREGEGGTGWVIVPDMSAGAVALRLVMAGRRPRNARKEPRLPVYGRRWQGSRASGPSKA